MTKLQSKLYIERMSALATAEQTIAQDGESEIAALKAQMIEVNARVQRQKVEARRAAECAHAELGPALAADFQREAAPLVQTWMKQPSRVTASALSDLFRTFDQRAIAELGTQLWDGVIANAFAAELTKAQPSAVNAFGLNDWGRQDVIQELGEFRKSAIASASRTESALAALESTLEAIALGARGVADPQLTRRFAHKMKCATRAEAVTNLAAFDESERERRNAEYAAAYVMPTPDDSLAPRPSQSLKSMVAGLLS